MPPANSIIAVHLNIGHKASHRSTVHPEGFTHDWSAYVKGAEGIDIQHFVEKVVFTLHETFKNPVQVVTKPPYMINESGYASFALNIAIYFNNKNCRAGENIIHYEYDLYLPGDGQPTVKYYRQERVLFKNTPYDFRARLKAGGAKETDPEAIEEEKKQAALTASGHDREFERQSSLTEKYNKPSDDEKKEKKKKHKDKSNKHKKSKPDRDMDSKHTNISEKSSPMFGLPRSQEDKTDSFQQQTQPSVSNSGSSSSSSSDSASPANSPTGRLFGNSQKPNTEPPISDSDSSSDSDEDNDAMNSSNNNSVKRPTSSNSNTAAIGSSTSKKPKVFDKPTKKSERNVGNAMPKAPNGIPMETLLDLHEKIRATEDARVLQRFVDVIEETNQYKLTENSFDFDLCRLDANTIHKLENMFK